MPYGREGYGGYGMSPLDFTPGGVQTANVGLMYGMGQQHAQQMQDEQTEEQLRQGKLAEQTYQLGQQKANSEIQDALAKGADSDEFKAVQNKYPAMAATALQDQKIQGMKMGIAQLGYVAAQSKAFDGDLFNLRDADDYISNRDALQAKYPDVTLPPASEFAGSDGDAKLAQWRDDERAKAGQAFKYSGKLSQLTADHIHALNSKNPDLIASTQKDLDNFNASEHAKLQKDVEAFKPTTATGTDVKAAQDFINGDSDLKQISDEGQMAQVKQQLAQAGHSMVQSKKAPDLATAFKILKSQIHLSPTHTILGMDFGGKKVIQEDPNVAWLKANNTPANRDSYKKKFGSLPPGF